MKYRDQRYEAVYERLAYSCDTPLDGDLFQMAIDEGHVDAYLDGSTEIDDLAFVIDGYSSTVELSDRVRQDGDSSQTAPASTERPGDHRTHALNAIFAIEAAARTDVASFRREHLENGLVDISEVTPWIERTAEIDGPPTVWITIPEEELNEATVSAKSDLFRLPGYSEDTHLLRYVTGGARFSHSIPIRSGGILAELADTTHWVATRYGWKEGATTTFILTGLPPAAEGINAQKIGAWPRSIHPKRIRLDIPISATSGQVAEAFNRLRDQMLGGQPRSRLSLTKQTADLAVFAAEHSTGHTWKDLRADWNRSRASDDDGRIEDTTRFTRDSREAYRRITGKKLEWTGKHPKASLDTDPPKET